MTKSRKILFLCHRLPFPPTKGDKIRSYALLKHLISKGTVHLGCLLDDRSDFAHLATVRELVGGECYFEFLSPLTKLRRAMRALTVGTAISVECFRSARLEGFLTRSFQQNEFDDVVIFGSAMAPYLFKPEFMPHRVLFDMVDVDSDKWRQYAKASGSVRRWLYSREADTLLETERLAAQLFGKTLLVSKFEAETFRTLAPESASKIGAITNGVDLEYFSPGMFVNPFSPGETPIVMTGHMAYRPNYEGAMWFIKEIFPLVKERVPNARAYFVGASPPAVLRSAANADVVVTGQVADVRPYLHFATAVIAPLQIARGVQNKVLEAMSMGKPVIATREAIQGLEVQPGIHLLTANAPEQFSEAVVSVIQGSEREALIPAAREYVTKNHDWEAVLSKVESDLQRVRRSQSFNSSDERLLCLASK